MPSLLAIVPIGISLVAAFLESRHELGFRQSFSENERHCVCGFVDLGHDSDRDCRFLASPQVGYFAGTRADAAAEAVRSRSSRLFAGWEHGGDSSDPTGFSGAGLDQGSEY
jgi:hypothetical protein